MSLVNDMLRDLDARQRTSGEGFKTVPAKSPRRRSAWLWIGLVVVLIAAALWLRTAGLLDSVFTESVPTASTTESGAAPASASAPVVEPSEKPAPVVARSSVDIAKISWMAADVNQGTLTFWLTAPTGFSLHNRTEQQLDIELENTRLAGPLPEQIAPLLTGFDITASDTGSRFVLSSDTPVRFNPQLKQGPDRLVVRVSRVTPQVLPEPVAVSNSQPAVSESVESAESVVTPAEPEKVSEPVPVQQPAPATKGEWRKAHNTLPTDATMVRNARRLLAQNRTNDAIAELQQFVQQQPTAQQSRFLLTQLYLAIENYPAAQTQFKQAPQNLSWGLLEARALLQQGKGQAAQAVLERFTQYQRNTDYIELRAAAAQQQQDYAQAAASYLQLLEQNAAVARWWINLGMVLEQQGHTAKALDAYRTAQKAPDVTEPQRTWLAVQQRRLTQ